MPRIEEAQVVNRRGFLQTGALAAGASATLATTSGTRARENRAASILPTRALGKTGVDVTILTQGTWKAPGLDRLLRFAYANGIRYFDAAKSYGSEPAFKRWFQQMPEVRKEIFLVTKDVPRHEPGEILRLVNERLETLGTDYIDLFFIHALGDRGMDQALTWPKSPELARAVEKLKKLGKIKFFGFSTHHLERARILQAAAEGGFIDAIMLQFSPWLDKDSPLNKAIDVCHAKGIGLISMKQVAGQGVGDPTLGKHDDNLEVTARRIPDLKERGLSLYQGLLTAIWSDERIATACVSMRNTDQIRQNVAAARKFGETGPLREAALRQLRDTAQAHGPTLCADCDGRCSVAAGTRARLGDLTRYLTYHDHHGYRSEARRLFAELSDSDRDWHGADLDAARRACPNKLDFARLLPRVDERLA